MFGADELGKPGFPRAVTVASVDLGREGGVEVAADPPPQCRCGMIIRQRLAVDCGAQELFGVDPGIVRLRPTGRPEWVRNCRFLRSVRAVRPAVATPARRARQLQATASSSRRCHIRAALCR